MGSAGSDDCESGFGMIEILISLTLLALLVAAFAPLLAGTLQLSARSAALATATQVANEQVERARGAAVTCGQLRNFLDTPTDPVTDTQGRTYSVAQTSSSAVTCAPSGGTLVGYQVTVSTDGAYAPGDVTITTEIWTAG